MKTLLTATLLLASIVLVPGAAVGQPETVVVSLASGAQEVPPVSSRTKATLRLRFRPDLSAVSYSLGVRRAVDVVAAHLHCGPAGANGPVVALLFGGGPVSGAVPLASGVLKSSDLIPLDAATCGLPINNIASLLTAIREDLVYLNVHSLRNLGGEVRAQVLHLH